MKIKKINGPISQQSRNFALFYTGQHWLETTSSITRFNLSISLAVTLYILNSHPVKYSFAVKIFWSQFLYKYWLIQWICSLNRVIICKKQFMWCLERTERTFHLYRKWQFCNNKLTFNGVFSSSIFGSTQHPYIDDFICSPSPLISFIVILLTTYILFWTNEFYYCPCLCKKSSASYYNLENISILLISMLFILKI